jgi:hypothetical protein|tara:strand:- start:6444 stop:6656 length:213 start_codon:yes stop_codon:yes gene_type:complete
MSKRRDLVTIMKLNRYRILGCLKAQMSIRLRGVRYYYDKTVYCDICGRYQEREDYKNYKMCKKCYDEATK